VLGILIFKGLTAQRLYELFGVWGVGTTLYAFKNLALALLVSEL
jgi:hypothetical protein